MGLRFIQQAPETRPGLSVPRENNKKNTSKKHPALVLLKHLSSRVAHPA